MKLEDMQTLLDDFCIPLQLATGHTQKHSMAKSTVSLALMHLLYRGYKIIILFHEKLIELYVILPLHLLLLYICIHVCACVCMYIVHVMYIHFMSVQRESMYQLDTHTHSPTHMHAHTHTNTHTDTQQKQAATSASAPKPVSHRPVGRPRVHSINSHPVTSTALPPGKVLANKEGINK